MAETPSASSAKTVVKPAWNRYMRGQTGQPGERAPSGFCNGCGYPDTLHLTALQRVKAEKGTLNPRAYAYRPGTDCFLRRKAVRDYEASLAPPEAEVPEADAVAGDED